MKVSHRATYGILSIVDLALHGQDTPVQAKAIARRQEIPIRFLEQVLHAMKKAGLVESVRGAQGGYLLVRKPTELSVADVLEVLEGPIFHETSLLGLQGRRADTREQQLLGGVWEQVQRAEQAVLQNITIDQLAARQRDLDQQHTPMYHI